MTDAAHLFSDVTGFAISIFSVTLSTVPKTKVFTYGYHRAEILGAMVSILLIWVITIVLMALAYDRIKNPTIVDAKIMFGIAGIGLLVNLIMMFVLKKDENEEEEEENMNVRAAYIHVIGDAIQSVGVIAASVIIYFGGPEYTIADPICTYVFAVLVMGTTIPIMSESIRALMEGSPEG